MGVKISDEQRAEIAAARAADEARRQAEAKRIMSSSRNPARSAPKPANPARNNSLGGQPAPKNTDVKKRGTSIAATARRRELRMREMAGMGTGYGSQSTDDHQ